MPDRPQVTDDPTGGEPTAAPDAGRGTTSDTAGRPRRTGGFLGELPVLVLIAFVLALLLKAFLVQAFFIPSSSMEPTLLEGDRVLVNKVVYDVREPHRGEVVVFTQRAPDFDAQAVEGQGVVGRVRDLGARILGVRSPGERDFIKRIIGLPGETIEMRNGLVLVDGAPLPEDETTDGGYLSVPDLADFGPFQIPAGQYFMMGDNRPNSADSRFAEMGPISGGDIVGRAFVVIWPLDRLRLLSPWEYGVGLRVSALPGELAVAA